MTEEEYAQINASMRRYKGNHGHGWRCDSFALIVCRECGRRYAGWFKRGELVDSSFFSSFNDEPGPDDEPENAPRGSSLEMLRSLWESDRTLRARVAELEAALRALVDDVVAESCEEGSAPWTNTRIGILARARAALGRGP